MSEIDIEDCIKKCIDSKTCRVVGYKNNNCQHSSDEIKAPFGRIKQSGWSQYKKDRCTTPIMMKDCSPTLCALL